MDLLSSLMETAPPGSDIKLHSCLSSAYILPVINSWKCSVYFLPSLCLSVCLSFLEYNHSRAKLCSAGATPPLPPTAAKLSYAVESLSPFQGALSLPPLCCGSLFQPTGKRFKAWGDPAPRPATGPVSNHLSVWTIDMNPSSQSSFAHNHI